MCFMSRRKSRTGPKAWWTIRKVPDLPVQPWRRVSLGFIHPHKLRVVNTMLVEAGSQGRRSLSPFLTPVPPACRMKAPHVVSAGTGDLTLAALKLQLLFTSSPSILSSSLFSYFQLSRLSSSLPLSFASP